MMLFKNSSFNMFVLAAVCFAGPIHAQETVTIPKSRLEQLERKAAELEKLKKELHQAQGEKEQLKAEQEQLNRAKEEAEGRAAAAAVAMKADPRINYVSPPMSSLSPLRAGEVVNATDLMNHYAGDAAAAEQRYGKGTLRVQGEVSGLEKPIFVRHYTMLLKTANPQRKVVCTVYPPDHYKTLFTVKHGAEMAWGDDHQGPITFVKVGQTVLVEGKCKGLHDANVVMGSCVLKEAQ
jgi:hypothetical protein